MSTLDFMLSRRAELDRWAQGDTRIDPPATGVDPQAFADELRWIAGSRERARAKFEAERQAQRQAALDEAVAKMTFKADE